MSKPESRVTVPYRYSATVNGKRRKVSFMAPRGLDAGEVISLFVDNHETNYKRFYLGATDKDYDAERVDELVEVFDWSEVT